MKKKIAYMLMLLLAIVCLFTLVACGQSGKNDENKDDDNGSQVTHPETPDDTHKHKLSLVSAKSADCVNVGNIAYYTCTCGKWFSDIGATKEITDKSGVVLNATGHSYAPNWRNTATQHWHECSVCGDKKDIANHTAGPEATTTTAQICTVCEYVLVAPLGHKHSLTFVPANPATCTTKGNIAYFTCDCGKWFSDDKANNEITDKSSVILNFTEHNYSSTWSNDEAQHWHSCTVCGNKKDIESHHLINDKCSLCNFEANTLVFTQYGNGYAVTGYTGSATSVMVPATYQGKSVTAIGTGFNGFRSCFDLEEIILPDSIRVINECAFENCGNLKSIKLPTNLISISNRAFQGCTHLESIEIPNGIIAIEFNTFYGCINLKSVIIPNSVTSFSSDAFEGCTRIESATIPMCALSGLPKDSLTNVKLTNGSELLASSFENCTSLKEITLPESLSSIGANAFSGCSGISSIVIPQNVTMIGDSAFSGCIGLTSVMLYEGIVSVGHNAFLNCKNLKNIALPNSVEKYGNVIFGGCESLESVTVPFVNFITNSLGYEYQYPFGCLFGTTQYAESYAVQQQYSVKSPNGTKSTNNIIYYFPSSLTNVTVLRGDIQSYAFYECGFPNITLGNAVTSIAQSAFERCYRLTSISIPDSVSYIGVNAFSGCTNLEEIKFGSHISTIGDYAFYRCHNLKNMSLPNSIETIGDMAFRECENLHDIVIPDGTMSIGEWAFYKCSNLTTISIPDSVKTLGSNAFGYCTGLIEAKVGNGVKSLSSTFSDCNNLIKATIIGNNELILDNAVLFGCNSLKNITLPFVGRSLSQDKYFVHIFGALQYSDIQYLPPNLETITITGGTFNNNSFYGCNRLTKLTDITLPHVGETGSRWESKVHFGYIFGAKTYSENAEYLPPNLENVTILNSDSIGIGAFYGCGNLKSISVNFLPDDEVLGAYSIGARAFSDCSNLINVSISGGTLSSIGQSAFFGCSKLESITIPCEVTCIESYTFSGCSSLTQIEIPSTISSIRLCAFSGCSGLKSVTIPSSVMMDATAFNGCSNLEYIVIEHCADESPWDIEFENCEKLNVIFFKGSQSQFTQIKLGESLSHATVYYYYSSTAPTDNGNYWHYDTDGKTPVIWIKDNS